MPRTLPVDVVGRMNAPAWVHPIQLDLSRFFRRYLCEVLPVAWLLALFAVTSVSLPLLRRQLGTGVFAIAAIVSAAAAVVTALQLPEILSTGAITETAPWVPQLGLNLDVRIDALGWLMAMIVTGIGTLVLGYCHRYFDNDEPGLGRFAAALLGFAGVMYGLVTTDNIYLLFVFWEITSVLSFVLIGHYTGRRPSRGAAMQALLVTTLGGLAMMIGVVILATTAQTPLLHEIVAHDFPHSPLVITAVMLVLAGAITKSAIVPFHFWLPGAMAAPTPVSAYLHAASMVKAGIYLVLRLAPGIAEVPGVRETLIVLGIWTMLVGGWRSLRQFDLKLILAFGTVSQLGFLMVVAGFGTRDAVHAAMAMLLGHALFKAALFLCVGTIDHRFGTRDVRKLSGLGRTMPVLAATAIISGASMAGIAPLWGFVAKEAVFTAFIQGMAHGDTWALVACIGTAIGSVLTVAYTARLLYGAFAQKPGRTPTAATHSDPLELISPIVLTIITVALPFVASNVDPVLAHYADGVPALDPAHPYHLAIWHGFEPALWISLGTLALGIVLFVGRSAVARIQSLVPPLFESARGYWATLRLVDLTATQVTSATQRGSLPFYLTCIYLVLIVAMVASFVRIDIGALDLELSLNWPQTAGVIAMCAAAIAATGAQRRFQGVVLVGVTGYAMAAVFGFSGAPDLATTQALIETMSLVVFVLVLRRLPAKHAVSQSNLPRLLRWGIAIGVATVIGGAVLIAMGNRIFPSDGLAFSDMAVHGGHGTNVVNVTLVDIRGWDTMGELSVLIAAATGVASLIYLKQRSRHTSQSSVGSQDRTLLRRLVTSAPTPEMLERRRADESRRMWLIAGHSLAPEHRSIVVEVLVRLIFHAMIITSLFLLFAGHNEPGGGFAGGVVAGLALTARYLAGGYQELDEAVRIDAGRLLGIGMVLAAGSALVPMFFGQAPLTSSWIDTEIPFLGDFVFVSSTVFDVGVYLVVVGLVIDILRSLASQLDRWAENEELGRDDISAVVLDESEIRWQHRGDRPMTQRIQIMRERGQQK